MVGPYSRVRIRIDEHRRVGKRLVPPMLDVGRIKEVSWVDSILPDLLWIGAINDRFGIRRGASICADLADKGKALLSRTGKHLLLARAAAYEDLDEGTKAELKAALHNDVVAALQTALRPIATAYPKFPMAFLTDNEMTPPEAITEIKRLLTNLFDRWNVPSTLIQIHAVYMAFVQDRLFVAPNTSLANFPAVENYPNTEESQIIASSCRATVTSFFTQDQEEAAAWPTYFWARGLELEACKPVSFDDD